MMIRKGMFIGDRYEIVDKVGSGGMSDVYKALDHKLNRYVAVKVLKDEFSEDKGFVSKFKVEAQSAAGLTHPNIVNVYDVGEDNGIYYIVMELVEGITLKKYIEKKGKLSIKESVSIAIQVAQGIEAAHNNHIIHRDIKPQNVIISREGKVKVTDFGIARAASANTINSNAMGSVHYISPEQARGGYIDEKSDIYSLGISLYEMLTGKVPFEGDSTVTIALQHINEELPSAKLDVPELPISVEKIVEKCTQKKAEHRYLKVATLIADLKRALVTPDEDFVVMVPNVSTDATIMITDDEVSQIRANKAAMASTSTMAGNVADDIDDIDVPAVKRPKKDDVFGDDDDIDATNPKLDRIVTIGAIVASVVILIVFILIFINVYKGCDTDTNNPYESGTSSSTENTGIAPTKTVVPDVTNVPQDDAEQRLKNANLGVRFEYEYHNTIPEGYVIRQSEKADSVIDKHKTVTVYVSNGAKKFDIPSVEGLTMEQAMELLTNDTYGLVVEIKFEETDKVEANYCIKTSPQSPTQLTYGSHITLYVATVKDMPLIDIPAGLVGSSKEKTVKTLEDLGFVVNIKEVNSETVTAGKVINIEYKEGTSVPKGTTIAVTVSIGPKEVETQTVTKTKVPLKPFGDDYFKLPTVKVAEESVVEGETGEDGEPVTTISVTEKKVEEGTLTASLIVKHDGKTTTLDITDQINAVYATGYYQRAMDVLIEELDVTEVTFTLTLTYESYNETTGEYEVQSPYVIYTEDRISCSEVQVQVEVTE